ncbi:MAG: hypothetical protein H8E72_06660 [Candidatus Marinimicrobia bacterium]|nr:hypothetical protein [Candidatus Neomarinimicrobiota bacterium]
MKFLRFILTFSLILNLGTQAAISCDMKACKISKKVTSCCKKEMAQQTECCCAKMKCKTTKRYNDVFPPVVESTNSLQYEHLAIQDVITTIKHVIPFQFSATYFHWANPPSKNNIPLLT